MALPPRWTTCAGDTLVVWRLDRLGRTLRHLIAQVTALDAVGVGFRSLTEAIDTTTGGKLVFHIFGALAEFERDLIRERTRAGLAAARARGRMGGRPRALSDSQIEMARVLLADPLRPIDEVCAALHVSRATLYRYVPTGSRPARAAPPERVARARGPTAARAAALGAALSIGCVLTHAAATTDVCQNSITAGFAGPY